MNLKNDKKHKKSIGRTIPIPKIGDYLFVEVFLKDKIKQGGIFMKTNYLIFIFLFVLFLMVGCTNKNENIVNDALIKNYRTTNLFPNYETIFSGDVSGDSVLVGLTPLQITDTTLTLQIGLNTHSVVLSQFDLKEIVVLEYEGKIVKPVEVPSLSGHHSSGNLVFNTEKNIKEFKVTIFGIPTIETRVFEWSLTK